MKRRTFTLLMASLLGGLPPGFAARTTPTGQARGKLMWDPVYLELPPDQKAPWDRWLADGLRIRQEEIRLFEEELRQSGRRQAAPAKLGVSFEVPEKPASWFAGPDAKKTADHLLSWQSPGGGWTKNTAMSRQRRAAGQRWSPWGEWDYVATIDNKATTSQIDFLARVALASGSKSCLEGMERGLRYLLAAQMPSGGWPQVFPLQGTYHDQITFNDDAMVRVLTLLRNIKNQKTPWQVVRAPLRQEIELAVARGIECILRSQIQVNGKLTAWCAQHHPITLVPVGARAYELSSISGGETVGILKFLMALGNPAPQVIDAVEAGVAWLKESQVDAGKLGLKGARGPHWARFYEIETNRALFSDLDGKKRYSFKEVKQKKNSYAWFTESPDKLIRENYPKWRRKVVRAG